jgi:pilus assembly protein CpaB
VRAKSLLLILVAVVMAGATALLVRGWLEAQRAAMTPPPAAPAPVAQRGPEVLVAKIDLAVGQFIRPEHLRWQPWPEGSLAPSYVLQGRRPLEDFVGAVVRNPISAGEPVTEGRVVVPGNSGFLAAVLQPGMRAVSVAVNPTSGISGFVFPGDRVDVILTHNLPRDQGGDETRRGATTVLQDIRVLALDQRMDSQPGQAIVAHNATFEVTPRQGQLIAVAAEVGRLSLSLRSLAREEQPSEGDTGSDGKPAQAVAAVPAPAVPGTAPGAAAPTPGAPTPAGEQTYVLDSDTSPLLPPPNVQREAPGVTVFRGRAMERVRSGAGGIRGNDSQSSEAPNRGGEPQ